jgi:hypothetical protein
MAANSCRPNRAAHSSLVSMFAIFFVLMTFNGQKDTLKARVIVSAIISAICSVLFWFQINRHDIFG